MKKLFFRAFILMFTLVLSNCTDDLKDIKQTQETSERNEITTAGRITDDTISNFFIPDYVSSQNRNLIPQASLRSSSDELIDKAMEQLEDLDKQQGFIKNVVRKYGYPIWDYSSILYATHREEVVITPLAFTDGEVSTAYFIAIHVNDKFWFRLVKKDKMDKAIEGKGNLKNWENLPFGVLKSVIVDKYLFGHINQPYINWLLAQQGDETGAVSGLRSCTSTEVTVCEEELVQAVVAGNIVCTTYYQSVCDTPGGESGRCQECSGNDPNSGSTSGGSSGTSNDDEFEDIIVNNATTPCVRNIIDKIKDDSFGPDLFVEILRDVFDVSTSVNIAISEARLAESIDGISTYTLTQIPDLIIFNGEITLNNRYTSTASQDWILATIIHEAIHSYIQYNEELVNNGLMSQDEFDRLFPLFTMDDTGHLTMGLDYVNKIADILKRNNPNLSQEEALALSRIGLHDTGYWAFTLSTQEKRAAIRANNIGRGTETSSTNTQKNCP